MLTKKTILILSLATFQSYAGVGDFIEIIIPDKEMKECQNKIEQLNKKTNKTFPNYQCNDQVWRIKFNQSNSSFNNCAVFVATHSGNTSEALDVCYSDDVRFSAGKSEYSNCLNSVKKFDLGREQYRACTDKSVTFIIKDPVFNNCFDYLEANQGMNSYSNFNTCKDFQTAQNITSPDFRNCVTSLSKLGMSTPSSVRYCMNRSNQNSSHLDRLANCTTEITKITGSQGLNYCLNLNHSLDSISNQTLDCVSNIKKKFLDKTFFPDESLDSGSNLLRNLFFGCEKSSSWENDSEHDSFRSMKVFGSNKKVQGTLVGGLSGLTYDKKTKSLIVVSDDPGLRNNSRVYEMTSDTSDITSMTFLDTDEPTTANNNQPFRMGGMGGKIDSNIDAEGIALLPNNMLAVSSETLLPGSDAFIRLYQKDGKQKKEIRLSDKFLPRSEDREFEETVNETVKEEDKFGTVWRQVKRKQTVKRYVQVAGVQPNKAFEALTSVPGAMTLITANEYPLAQDEIPNSRIVRITRLNGDMKGNFTSDAEFAYELEQGADNGLVELAAIDDRKILVLERRFNPRKQKVTARIFEVDLSVAKNYSKTFSLAEEAQKGRIETLNKRLIIDLDEVELNLPQGIKKIDNFEGMAIGPKLPNGKYLVYLVTDNNFSSSQLTQILTLELSL